jgi:hypothetical protein
VPLCQNEKACFAGTGDPLLTIRSKRQLVAANGNGLALVQAIFRRSTSRTFATGCAPSVP